MSRLHNLLPDFETMVAAGYIPGVKHINKFGYNSDIDTTSDPEDVWGPGGIYTGFPTGAPETVEVFSSNAADKGTPTEGTGGRTCRIYGLESSLSTEYTYEDLTLDGTSAVTSTKTWFRVNRVQVMTAGSSGHNVGTITCRHTSTTSNVFAVVPAQFGQSTIACWSLPHNNKAVFTGIRVTMSVAGGGAGSAVVLIQRRKLTDLSWKAQKIYAMTPGAAVDETFSFPFTLEGFHDIRMRVFSVSSNNTRVHGGFSAFYGLQNDIRDALLSRASL